MKPLLLLLSFSLIVVQSTRFFPGRDCNGLPGGFIKNVSSIRADKCNAETGVLELFECRLPEQNRTIPANKDVEEIIDGKKYITRCTADGVNGLDIVTRAVKEISAIEQRKVPGFCIERTNKWVPNQQWDDGDFVKRCNPETFQAEIIGCLSHGLSFVPRGSNRTDVFDSDNGLRITQITICLAVGNATQIERKYFEEVAKTSPRNSKSTTTQTKTIPWKQKTTTTNKPTTTSNPVKTVSNIAPYDCRKDENIGKEWVVGNIVRRCAREKYGFITYNQKAYFCITPEGDRIKLEQERKNVDGSVYECVKFNRTEARLDLLSPAEAALPRKCPIRGRLNGDPWIEPHGDEYLEMRCVKTASGELKHEAVACSSGPPKPFENYRIPVGESQYVEGRRLLKCAAQINGLPRIELGKEKCDNGKEYGDEWVEGAFLKKCVYDEITLDDGELVVAVKACLHQGVQIPVGEQRQVPNGTCECFRTDIAPHLNVYPTMEAAIGCANKSATSQIITPFDCSKEENLDKEWRKGAFYRACKKVEDGAGYSFKEIAYRCITAGGFQFKIEEEDVNADGSVNDCVRVNETEARLDWLPKEVAALPRKCANGRRVNTTWVDYKENLQFSCHVKNGKATISVIACTYGRISPSGYIKRVPLGEIGNVEPMHTGGLRKCVPTEDGKARSVVVKETCENGKEIHQEWREANSKGNFIKGCVFDTRTEDGQSTIVVVKACITDNITIPVGETRKHPEGGTCFCVRDPPLTKDTPTFIVDETPVVKAKAICKITGPGEFVVKTSTTSTKSPSTSTTLATPAQPEALDCSIKENLDKEQLVGFVVMACKKFESKILSKYISTVKYVAVRCITPERHDLQIGMERKTSYGIYKCMQMKDDRARLDVLAHLTHPHCDNGWPYGHTEVEGDIVRICNHDLVPQARACYIPEFRHYMNVASFEILPNGTLWVCEKRGELDAALIKKTLHQFCLDGDLTLESLYPYPRSQWQNWKEDNIIKSCVKIDGKGANEYRVVSVGCITDQGDALKIGEQKKYDNVVVNCESVGEFDAQLRAEMAKKAPEKCSNGLERNHAQFDTKKGVIKSCSGKLESSVACVVQKIKAPINVGQSIRENGTLYICEKRGEFDAELVVKSFSQLCEEGDTTVDAWISEGVLRECARKTVYARMCVLPDGEIIKVLQNITYEFESFRCESVGVLDAKLTHDISRTHPSYFTTPGKCKNGKFSGEEWTENEFVRRACREKKGVKKPVIVDLGCVLPTEKIVPVGSVDSWVDKDVEYFLHCKEGQKGFGATHAVFSRRPENRTCENRRVEGEQWEARNVLRTCKEIDDKMTVVAIRCVFGNESLEIGQIRLTSELSSIECARVGKFDAAILMGIVPVNTLHFCDNGRKLNEEWTDEKSIRKSCRIRSKKSTIVALGCILDDGKILAPGEKRAKRATLGYSTSVFKYECHKSDIHDALLVTSISNTKTVDEKSPCGEKRIGEIWELGSFLKKCKVIDDGRGEKISAVTIGCVTLKGKHMLENERRKEDDYRIICDRAEDGKMEMHYEFIVKENDIPAKAEKKKSQMIYY